MKRIILLIVLILICFPAAVFADEPLTVPTVEAQGAILMDFETGRVLWEKNARTPMAMASTTKIMTCIIALENGDLADTVTVSRRAAAAPKVKMNLQIGEKISLESLLYALMLQSSNDAAVAIAEHVGGTVENFCDMMTEKAKKIGANDTLFVTPNGLDAGDHHSTAYDMALITRYALKNQKFVDIINTKQININSNKKGYYVANKNRLLNEFEGANGVKTGFTGKAGQCFVGSANRDGLSLISVVFASGWGDRGKEQKWTDTKRILSYGFSAYEYEDIVDEKAAAGMFNIERSKTPKMSVYYSEGLTLPLTEAEKASLKVEIDLPETIRAPIVKDNKIGTAKIYINGEVYKEIDLLADGSAERHDLKTSLEKVLGAFLEMGTVKEIDVVLPEF